MLKIAFAGFRHGHIMGVYNYVRKNTDTWRLTGACEEDESTRRQLAADGKVDITHTHYAGMLDAVECDVVAVGDYYVKRGSLIIEALRRGKHVISDKPICADLAELEQIAALSAEKGLKIGCQLDLRTSGNFRRLRKAARDGMIGEALSVFIGGQHPLNVGVRPAWYFEDGKHGGTINDIGIHAFDLIPWVTGVDFAEVVAARVWNALAPQFPKFQTGAQFILRLQNNAGVTADMSYFSPAKFTGKLPQYWRTTLFGAEGVMETSSGAEGVMLARNGHAEVEVLPAAPPEPDISIPGSFAREVLGETAGLVATTAEVLRASRAALLTQRAADTKTVNVKLS